MTREEIHAAVLRAIGEIVPEVDPATLATDRPLRDQLDIDSMDFLNIVIELDQDLGIEVPEADYGRLTTIDATVDYLDARLRT